MDKYNLLNLFDKNEYISGEIIAANFNVTRAAVWKAVADLKKEGYEIESKTNNGYRLLSSTDILNEHEIKSKLKNKDIDIIYKKSTGSTNDDAKKIAGKNNMIIVSGEQSAGRGRYGRSFISENGGLYFTIKICRPNNFFNIEGIAFYPLIMAVAASRAVYDLCGINLYIKWPNDLLCDYNGYKKVAGILTEASVQAETRDISYIIAGIGLNVNTEFNCELKDTASSLKIITGQNYDRVDLLCMTVENFMRFVNSSREYLLEEYKKRLLTGVRISFAQNGREYIGLARGINESGNLLAEVDGQIITVQSGEINFI